MVDQSVEHEPLRITVTPQGSMTPGPPSGQADDLEGAGARTLARRGLPRGAATPASLEPLPTISDQTGYEALDPGKQYKDPEGNVRTKLWEVADERSYDLVPEGQRYTDPQGNVRTKPSYEPVDFTAHTLYNMAVTDSERRKALERSYPGKVKQDTNGEFYVAPIYNHLDGPVGWFEIDDFHDMGTPEGIEQMLAAR